MPVASFKTLDVPEGWLRVGRTRRRKEKVVGREVGGRICYLLLSRANITHITEMWHSPPQNQIDKVPGETAL